MKTFSLIFFCAALLSCSVLPERVPTDLYQLPPSRISTTMATTISTTGTTPVLRGLRIATPATADSLGGTRILAMVGDNSFQAYPEARWAAPVPQLWRDWLLDAFWRDGRVSELSASSDGLQASLELSGMLRGLHNEYMDGRAVAVIQYDARLVDTATRRIISSRRFEAREPVSGTAVNELVAALGTAADRVAVEVIAWTLEQN